MRMKKFYLPIFVATLFVFQACNFRPTNMEGNTNSEKLNRINREKVLSFQGIKLGTPNDIIQLVLDSLENVIAKEIDPFVERLSWQDNGSIFGHPYETMIKSFFTSIVDTNNQKYSGYGMIFSSGDSITKIHYIIPSFCLNIEIDSVYSNLKKLFEEQYGDPDKEYENKIEADLQNIGSIWDFSSNQRIYLNKCIPHSGFASDFQRVEIVYQDMNSIQRQNKRAEEERIQAKKEKNEAVEKEKQKNAKEKEKQQI